MRHQDTGLKIDFIRSAAEAGVCTLHVWQKELSVPWCVSQTFGAAVCWKEEDRFGEGLPAPLPLCFSLISMTSYLWDCAVYGILQVRSKENSLETLLWFSSSYFGLYFKICHITHFLDIGLHWSPQMATFKPAGYSQQRSYESNKNHNSEFRCSQAKFYESFNTKTQPSVGKKCYAFMFGRLKEIFSPRWQGRCTRVEECGPSVFLHHILASRERHIYYGAAAQRSPGIIRAALSIGEVKLVIQFNMFIILQMYFLCDPTPVFIDSRVPVTGTEMKRIRNGAQMLTKRAHVATSSGY